MGITVRGKMLQKALVSEGDKAYSNKNSISTKATKFTIIGIRRERRLQKSFVQSYTMTRRRQKIDARAVAFT